jgi:hypothetical protein
MNTPLALPTGIVNDDTAFAAQGRWFNGDKARFYGDSWQVKGGWERLILDNLNGVCRSVFSWTDATNDLNIGFGRHNGLSVWRDNVLYDITPAAPPVVVALPNNAFTTTNASAVVTVNQPAHGLVVGQKVTLAGATVVATVAINGTWTVLAVPDANTWTFTAASAANAAAVGGGAAATSLSLLPGFTAGQIDGTGGAGYGTGAYGVGTYGTPSVVDYFPLTWSQGNWGGFLLANPRNQTIFLWQGVAPGMAAALPNAPANVTYMLSLPQRQVMALGCNESVSGTFNPLCIRWSDIEDYTDWTEASNNNAGEWVLESGGRIVCGRIIGDYVLVWTTDGVFLGSFVGAIGQTWKFERIGMHCGSISPGCPVVSSQNVAWISPSRDFWTYTLGGQPTPLHCDVRLMFLGHITSGQDDKIIGASVSTFDELTWFWPDDRDGFEVSRALVVSPGGWSRDLLARSAFCDGGPQVYPIGVSPSGYAYWHEKGNSADGGVLSGFLESTIFAIGEAEQEMLVSSIWPDLKSQQGVFNLTLFTRQFPQAQERAHGPWPLTPGLSRKNVRLSGRLGRVRWDWASAPAYARGGRTEFAVDPIGGR